MSQVNLIGISGHISAGKDTVGKLIQDLTAADTPFGNKYQLWQIRKFADKLKQIASILTGISKESFEDQEFKKTNLSEVWDSKWGRPLTVRHFLQRLGTDALRDNLHENIWVNALFSDYVAYPKQPYHPGSTFSEGCYMHTSCSSCKKPFNGYKRQITCKDCIESQGDIFPTWIITDVRFPNEAQAIKDKGGIVIRVKRTELPQVITSPKHPSETALDNYDFDYKIFNTGTMEELRENVKAMLLHYNLLS